MALVCKELKDGYIGEYALPIANTGPCPVGFHIPTATEAESLQTDFLRPLGLFSDQYESVLLLPPVGYLDPGTGEIVGQDEEFGYRTCKGTSDGYAQTVFNDDYNPVYEKAQGACIRPFKDNPVAPDNTRVKVFTSTDEPDGGIYINALLGLITIVGGDGTSMLTIADKNLGATGIYVSTDSKTTTNCGYYFQRGNNYGFPYEDASTISSTKVDASGYGPGNYYNNGTFITVSSAPMGQGRDWSSVANNDLWGGESV